jgi:hypothetical protein
MHASFMKFGTLVFLVLATSTVAEAQVNEWQILRTTSPTITANAGESCFTVNNQIPSVVLTVTGTWTGTLAPRFKDAAGTTKTPASGVASATSTTSNADISVSNLGFAQICLVATAWTSGTANITAIAGGSATVSVTGGDASAANQTTMIGHVDGLETLITATNAALSQAGTPIMVISDVTSNGDNEDEHAVCTADCTIFSVTAFNHTAASAFLRCEQDTIGNTTPGSETASANEPDLEIPASTTGAGFHLGFGIGISYTTALTCWIVSDEAASGTTDVAANDVRVLWNRVQ